MNIAFGHRFPFGLMFQWMGCIDYHFDFLFDRNNDLRTAEAQDIVSQAARKADVTTTGPACGIFSAATLIRRPELKGGGPPQLRYEACPLGFPTIFAKPDSDT